MRKKIASFLAIAFLGVVLYACAATTTTDTTGGPGGPGNGFSNVPTGVTATPGPGIGNITVSWNAVANVTGYNLYMATVPGVNKGNYLGLPGGMKHPGVTSPEVLTGLTPGTPYFFVVTSVMGSVETIESMQVTATPPSASGASIVGTWGVVSIHHSNANAWSSEFTRVTFNANNSCSGNGWWNNGSSSNYSTYTCTYSDVANADASHTLTMNLGGGPTIMKLVMSDNGNVAIMNGTGHSGEQFMMTVVRMDATKTYSNADFSGAYYTMSYDYDTLGASSGYYKSFTDISNSNGSGGLISNGVMHGDNYSLAPYQMSDTYIVNSSGDVFFSSLSSAVPSGHLSGDGKVLLYSNAGASTTDWMSGIAMKKGDMTYSTASLQGTWAISSFGDSNGTTHNFISNYGTMICNSTGQCAIKTKRNENGVITTDPGGSLPSIVVSADGSFGTYMAKPGDPANPWYSSAIGDGGNLLIMNLELNGDSRSVFIGVKCSACGDLTIAASPALKP